MSKGALNWAKEEEKNGFSKNCYLLQLLKRNSIELVRNYINYLKTFLAVDDLWTSPYLKYSANMNTKIKVTVGYHYLAHFEVPRSNFLKRFFHLSKARDGKMFLSFLRDHIRRPWH